MSPQRLSGRMLVRPVQGESESDWGFLLRLASENGLSQAHWLPLAQTSWATGRCRVCPTCLGEPHAFWAREWGRADQPWCSKHETWLVDRCSACGLFLRWSNVSVAECRCGQPLHAIPMQRIPLQLAACASSGVASLGTLRVLGAFALYGAIGKPGKKALRSGLQEVKAQLEAGASLAMDWERGWPVLLERRRVVPDEPGTVQLLRDAFPRLRHLVNQVPDAAWRRRINAAVTAYCVGSLKTARPIVSRAPATPSTPISLKQVARGLRSRTERIASLLDGEASASSPARVTQGGRKRRVLSDAEVVRVGDVLNETISTVEAARLIGLPVSRVRALVAAGLLATQGGSVSRRQVLGLVPLPATVSRTTPEALTPLRRALRDWIKLRETVSAIQWIAGGALPLQRPAPDTALGDCLVAEDLVAAFARGLRGMPNGEMNLGEAAAELGVKHDVVRDLIARGLLPARPGVVRGRRGWCVDRGALQGFRLRYAPLVELARRHGVRHRDAPAWARSQGLEIITGPQLDGSRQYFVRRPGCPPFALAIGDMGAAPQGS